MLREELDEVECAASSAECAASRHLALAGADEATLSAAKCEWGPLTKDTYSKCCTGKSCYDDCKKFKSVATAKAACEADSHCAAITGGGSNWAATATTTCPAA